jgi:hypothetical protein
VQVLNNAQYNFFLINCHQKLMMESASHFIRIFSKSEHH